MLDKELYEYFKAEYNKAFAGWDFSYIKDRMETESVSWNYEKRVFNATRSVHSMLDMGTGGGEFLRTLQPFPNTTYATEAYKPNVSVAKKNLEPLGVKVVEICDDEELPLKSNVFYLIINRHEAYSAREVYRLLKNGGYFITQQVGGLNKSELNVRMDADINQEFKHWNMKYAVAELEQQGFKIIENKEEFPTAKFYDIGAIIYYLKIIPWQIPDFSIERYFEKLKEIKIHIDQKGSLVIKAHRFFIVAEK